MSPCVTSDDDVNIKDTIFRVERVYCVRLTSPFSRRSKSCWTCQKCQLKLKVSVTQRLIVTYCITSKIRKSRLITNRKMFTLKRLRIYKFFLWLFSLPLGQAHDFQSTNDTTLKNKGIVWKPTNTTPIDKTDIYAYSMEYIIFVLDDFVKHHLFDDIVISAWLDFKGWKYIVL